MLSLLFSIFLGLVISGVVIIFAFIKRNKEVKENVIIVKEIIPNYAKEILIDEIEYITKLLKLHSFSSAIKRDPMNYIEKEVIRKGIKYLKRILDEKKKMEDD